MANARMDKSRQSESVKVSKAFLQMAARGGWSRKRLALLGIDWPPRAGWKKRIVGTWISRQAAQQLLGDCAGQPADTDSAQAHAREASPAAQADTGAPGEVVQIWTDGACQPNPGPGGWGWMAIDGDGVITEDFGGAPHTTNNRMEMTAILRALQALPDGCRALVMSDSQYCVNGLTIWRKSWQRKNWRATAPIWACPDSLL